jgi:hypothetical protein
LDFDLFGTDNLGLLIGNFFGSSDLNGDFFNILLKGSYRFLSSLKLDATRVILLSCLLNTTLLISKHVPEQGDELKERLGSGVDRTSLLCHDLGRELVHSGE